MIRLVIRSFLTICFPLDEMNSFKELDRIISRDAQLYNKLVSQLFFKA